MGAKKIEGSIAGILGLVFLLFPLVFVPPFEESMHEGFAYWMLLLNIPCIILIVQTKSMLNRSKVFGALFISSGLVYLYLVGLRIWSEYLAWLHEFGQSPEALGLIFLLFVLAPSIAAILVGVSLMIGSVRELRKRKKAEIWELEDQLKGLDEQLSLGHISQEQYEQNKKKLLKKEVSALPSTSERDAGVGKPAPMRAKRKERKLEDQLRRLDEALMYSVITEEEHEQKKKELLEGLEELELQLGRGDISFEEYHRKKQELLEK